MRYSRRSVLAAGLTGTLAATAGCLDVVTGDGPLEFAAERAAPTDSALEETGYEEHRIEEETYEESIDVGVEREIEAAVWLSTYAKEIEHQGVEAEGCFFGAISIPDASVLGRSLNPMADMSNEELLAEFLDELGEDYAIEDVTHEESLSLEVLDDEQTVDVFEGETDLEGQRVDAELKMASFSHEDDLLVLLGSYPTALEDEADNVDLLLESVEHPV